MSCPNANAPIDISHQNVAGKCDLKCQYNFKYPNSSCVATNRGDYISIGYDTFNSAPVKYNAIDYNVKEIRIYNPSLHSFDKNKAVGEIIIIHISNAGTKPLLVCIPLINNNTKTIGSDILSIIINNVSVNAPSQGGSTTIAIDNFTLNNFVPNKPFFSYTAIQPYQPCVGDVDIIVYQPNSANCYISNESLNKLKSINKPNTYTSKKGPFLFFNNKGSNQIASTGSDDIYIDCKPIDKSSEQTSVTNYTNSSSPSFNNTITWNNIKNNTIFQVIMGSLLFVFIIIIFYLILKFMSGRSVDLPKFIKNSSNNISRK
jgi:carbonic anhydrase